MLFFNFFNNNEKKYTKNIEKQGEIVCNCEFGYELQLVIPYAYYLYKHNKLKSTTSSLMTKELYYFSKNHHEKFTKRQFGVSKIIPNQTPHVKELNYNQYLHHHHISKYIETIFLYMINRYLSFIINIILNGEVLPLITSIKTHYKKYLRCMARNTQLCI